MITHIMPYYNLILHFKAYIPYKRVISSAAGITYHTEETPKSAGKRNTKIPERISPLKTHIIIEYLLIITA